MSFFDRIKSAVVGNPVTKEYEIGRHIASAGPGLLWKIYTAVKKSTRQEVSVFMFDKKAPEFDKMPKKQREAIFEMLKKGPTHLIKLRHPRLLTIEHQVEESNDIIAFATEPVFVSVANILGYYDNLPSPLPLPIKEYEIHPVEIQYGLLQVAEALDFLHTDVKMMHGNLIPSAIVITKKGTWKLMGFNFCCYSQYQNEAQKSFQFREWDSRKHVMTNPSLDYLAPEYILSQSCSELSDVYSFGMLCYAMYNGGKPLFENNNNMLTFKSNVEQVSRITETALGQVPAEFKLLVRSMFAVEPSVRPDALQITKHAFFEEVSVSTLRYLDQLYERGDMEKSQFFKKNLARVMTKLPQRIVHQRVLPALSSEFRNKKMIPFVLPLILLVAEDCSLQEYCTLIMPVITPALHIQNPIQIPLIFLQKMDLLLKKTPQDEVKRHILPMILSSLETEHGQVQELCVSILPTFASMMDYSSMKHSIIPRITALCVSSSQSSLQIKCLVCLAQMLDILDKHIVLDHIIPILEQIPTREPGVLMAILGIYHQTMTHKKLGIDKQMLACRILPFLIPLTIEPALNLKQFDQFMKVIREMLHKVEVEQQAHLDQLSKMEEQTKSTVQFAREVSEAKAMDDTVTKLENMFTGSGASDSPVSVPRRGTSPSTKTINWGTPKQDSAMSGTSDLLSGLTVNDMASALSSSTSNPATSKPSSFTNTTGGTFSKSPTGTSGGVDMGMGLLSSSSSIPNSNQNPSPQIARQGFQQTSAQQQSFLQPTQKPSPLQPSLAPSSSPSIQNTTLQPSKYTPPNQTSMGVASGTGMGSGYTPPTMRSQQPMGSSSGLGDMGILTGGTGQTSHTGFASESVGSLSSTGGFLQPTRTQQSGFSGMSSSTSNSATNSIFSGMQTGGSGGGGFTPQTQVNRPMQGTFSSSGGVGMSGASSSGGGTELFAGMQMNAQKPSNQTMFVSSGGGRGGGVSGGGLLQPMVPMQQQQQPNSSQSLTGWSSNINKQQTGLGGTANQMNSSSSYGGGQQQNVAPGGGGPGGWSSNIAGSSNDSSSMGSTLGGWSQNIGGTGGGGGMGIQPMQMGIGQPQMQSRMGMGQSQVQSGIGMGQSQLQSGVGMGQSQMQGMGAGTIGGGGGTWSTNIAGGNMGSTAPPTAAGLMMGGSGQPLMPQTYHQPQQQQATNRPAPGANPFADLNFLA